MIRSQRILPVVSLGKDAVLERIYGHCFCWIIKCDLLGAVKEGASQETIKLVPQYM